MRTLPNNQWLVFHSGDTPLNQSEEEMARNHFSTLIDISPASVVFILTLGKREKMLWGTLKLNSPLHHFKTEATSLSMENLFQQLREEMYQKIVTWKQHRII